MQVADSPAMKVDKKADLPYLPHVEVVCVSQGPAGDGIAGLENFRRWTLRSEEVGRNHETDTPLSCCGELHTPRRVVFCCCHQIASTASSGADNLFPCADGYLLPAVRRFETTHGDLGRLYCSPAFSAF